MHLTVIPILGAHLLLGLKPTSTDKNSVIPISENPLVLSLVQVEIQTVFNQVAEMKSRQ